MSESANSLIDLEKVIQAKMGEKARYVPRFAVGLLKRMIHQDYINGYLKEGYKGVEFCEKCLEYLGVGIEVEGAENLPDDGKRYTFVSNHPLGAIDGVALGMILGKRYDGKIKHLVNDFLMHLDGLAPLCIPVNKTGTQARDLPRLVDEAFHSDNQIIVFPAGTCSRSIDGKIQDLPWQKAFVQKSMASGRDIVPIHFSGCNTDRFYRIARLRKALKIKFNLEMLLLPDEMYRARGNTYRITVGRPIPAESLSDGQTAVSHAHRIRKIVYELPET